MSASLKTTPNPAARPATVERLGPECNFEVVLAEAAVFDGEETFDSRDGPNVDGVDNTVTKALGLKEAVTFGLMTKPRLVSVWLIKPLGLAVVVYLPVGSSI